MTPIPHNIPDCTLFLLAKAYQKAHGLFRAYLRPFDLTNLQHLVLEGLWYKEGVTAAELGKSLVLDKATLSGVLERMVESGWICKKRDNDDRRVFRIYPTEKANRMKPDLIALRIDANEKILEHFSTEERILFKRLLRNII